MIKKDELPGKISFPDTSTFKKVVQKYDITP